MRHAADSHQVAISMVTKETSGRLKPRICAPGTLRGRSGLMPSLTTDQKAGSSNLSGRARSLFGSG